jgi:hypothetical protein
MREGEDVCADAADADTSRTLDSKTRLRMNDPRRWKGNIGAEPRHGNVLLA